MTGKLRVVPAPHERFRCPRRATAEHVRTSLFGLAVGEGAVWVIGDALDHRLSRSRRERGRLLGAFPLPIAPQRIAAGAGASGSPMRSTTCSIKVDPDSGRVVQRIATGRGTDGVAVGAGSVWVACGDRRSGRAHRSGERPHRRERIAVGSGLREVAAGLEASG